MCVANIYEYNALTMNAEVIDIMFLAMMLGGTYNQGDKSISVKGDVPNVSYTGEGTFRVTTTTGDAYKKIKFYNLKAQVSADLTLSASEVSSFSLVLDIMADATGKIIDITDVVGLPSSASAKDDKVTILEDIEGKER